MRHALLSLGLMLGIASPLSAVNQTVWEVDTEKSSVSFEYIEAGTAKIGSFDSFTASIAFDPEFPEQASASFAVKTASIDLNDTMREGVLATTPWFNSDEFPKAEFSLQGLRLVSQGKYLAEGVLRVKTVELPVQVMLSLSISGGRARAAGKLEIDRTEFQLRDVLLESVVAIGERVTIGFDLVAISN